LGLLLASAAWAVTNQTHVDYLSSDTVGLFLVRADDNLSRHYQLQGQNEAWSEWQALGNGSALFSWQRGAARSFITDTYPPQAVHLTSAQKGAIIPTLQAEAKHADNKELQAISFVLAEWGIDYERNKKVLASSLRLCEVRDRSCDEDTAGYLIGLYASGHTDVLPVLVSVGPRTDAAVTETLGAFYQDVLAQTPERFFSVVRSLPETRQSEVCEIAGGGDGGGMREGALNRAKSFVLSARGESARSCFARIVSANKRARSQN
jgi:hypothetical protein